MRLGPAAGRARGPGPVLDRLHPRHGAGLPQADHRAARRVHRADVPGPDRRREVRPPAPARDHRRARARTSSSRTTSSASRRLPASGRPWVRIVSCNPAEIKDPAVAAVLVRATRPRTGPAGRRFLEEVRRTHGDLWADFDAFCREHGDHGLVYGAARAGLHLRIAVAQPVPLPGRGRLRARAPARPDLAPPGLDGPRGGHDLGAARAPARARRGADLPLAGLARVGRRRADAAAGRPAGDDRAPGHRVEGPAGRPDHAPRQPDGRGVPAPAGDPAAGRPGHHPRRQQHRHRGVPPRQADDRAAAVLGPGRQRPADRRDRVRAAPGDLRLPRRGADRRDRRAARRRRAGGAAGRDVGADQGDVGHGPRRRPDRARGADRPARHADRRGRLGARGGTPLGLALRWTADEPADRRTTQEAPP